ncbi:branched-chain amino acid ABC transporter permease [Aquamicrobium sp. LC103]|uniref:branched-chain amino acid ABC transporter permease n=1 Tax=Aquamicrobium sp. LC103 TaxID=1120658 RepID=UPI00063ECCCA|nr:branched-chain amino acid ABC transporter permease [Aquamicrobium sp. LC103]TKT77438.1 branched-chain amino acid ABC transporter permease [Aquamicrobium sp. LC103]
MLTNAILSGLTMGGMYALVAMGLTLQYGVSRIMNLAYGEFVIAASFVAFLLFTSGGLSPLVSLLIIVPAGFAVSYLVYGILLTPLVRRARSREALEADSILSTFGLLFIVQGLMLVFFGGNYTSYSYFNTPVQILGTTIAANRLVVLGFAVLFGAACYFFLMRTRTGVALRAVAVDPIAAGLVAVDVRWAAALAFALGGAIAVTGGVLVSMFLTFNANIGVVFTMKALIVVIMGGVGNVAGALAAGIILGLVESFVATFVDPGLTIAVTYAVFLAVLLVRPGGLFGTAK